MFEINYNLIEIDYYEDSWYRRKQVGNHKLVYYQRSTGYWSKSKYDSNGYLIYCESPTGIIIDKNK